MNNYRDTTGVLRDRTFIEQMKADILRRAEEMSDEEEEDGTPDRTGTVPQESVLLDEDEAANTSAVRVLGDGEDSGDEVSDEEGEGEGAATPQVQSPETILELAYIRDPKVFDRDSNTRRGKARADLKAQTGERTPFLLRRQELTKHNICRMG